MVAVGVDVSYRLSLEKISYCPEDEDGFSVTEEFYRV
jgi:hypothetical protein